MLSEYIMTWVFAAAALAAAAGIVFLIRSGPKDSGTAVRVFGAISALITLSAAGSAYLTDIIHSLHDIPRYSEDVRLMFVSLALIGQILQTSGGTMHEKYVRSPGGAASSGIAFYLLFASQGFYVLALFLLLAPVFTGGGIPFFILIAAAVLIAQTLGWGCINRLSRECEFGELTRFAHQYAVLLLTAVFAGFILLLAEIKIVLYLCGCCLLAVYGYTVIRGHFGRDRLSPGLSAVRCAAGISGQLLIAISLMRFI